MQQLTLCESLILYGEFLTKSQKHRTDKGNTEDILTISTWTA